MTNKAPRDVWRRQCEVVQRYAKAKLEAGAYTLRDDEINKELAAAGLPALNNEQVGKALNSKPLGEAKGGAKGRPVARRENDESKRGSA